MADSSVDITAGSGTPVDTRTESTNNHHRQVVVLGDPSANAGVAPVDATAGLKVDLGADNDVTVSSSALPTGAATAANQLPDGHNVTLAAGTNNIGDVDVLTMPNVTLAAGTNTNEVVGDVAHDAAAAGNPLLAAGISQDCDDTAPPNAVSAEGDATRIATDRDGALFTRSHPPRIWSYHENSSSQLTDATVKAAPGAGLSLYVTSITISLGAATAFNAFFEEGAATVLGPFYLEGVNGRGMHLVFPTPKKITPNTALTVTTNAAVAHSIEVVGFTAQG